MEQIEEWLKSDPQYREYDQWLSLLPWMYQLRLWLSGYRQLLLVTPQLLTSGNFQLIWQSQLHPTLQSYPHLQLPPLNALFGIGGRWVLRELVRLGVLPRSAVLDTGCFVHRETVRQLLGELGLSTEDSKDFVNGSAAIHQFLQDNGLNDPTFDGCFDLPLLLVALDPAFRLAAFSQTLAHASNLTLPQEEPECQI